MVTQVKRNNMDFSVVQALGHQTILQSGYWYDVNQIKAKPKDIVKLNHVLLYSTPKEFLIGKPCIQNCFVLATIVQHFRGKKICVFKYKPKKKYKKKKGYRPALTRILIKRIQEFTNNYLD